LGLTVSTANAKVLQVEVPAVEEVGQVVHAAAADAVPAKLKYGDCAVAAN